MKQLHQVLRHHITNGASPLPRTAIFKKAWEKLVPDVVLPALETDKLQKLQRVVKALPSGKKIDKFFQASAGAAAANVCLLVTRDLFWDMSRFLHVLARPAKKEELFKWAPEALRRRQGNARVATTKHSRFTPKAWVAKARDKLNRRKPDNVKSEVLKLQEDFHSSLDVDKPNEARSAKDALVMIRWLSKVNIWIDKRDGEAVGARPTPFRRALCQSFQGIVPGDDGCSRRWDTNAPQREELEPATSYVRNSLTYSGSE